jgi:hypothetical protein
VGAAMKSMDWVRISSMGKARAEIGVDGPRSREAQNFSRPGFFFLVQ